MVGKSLLHYEILGKIGAGGMGEVYRARDTKLNREVALKVLPAETARDPERRARFEREAQAIAALKHPNIVMIHSVEEAEDLLFLTMELVEGQPLSDLIPERGLSLGRFFDLAIPLTDAVASAHDKRIIHRDLKPANVMLDDAGRVKILDFGLAKLVEAPPTMDGDTLMAPQDSETGEGRVLGTAAYMSPEQAEGKQLDHRSDIFSLGTLMYEMVTGERPFKGDTGVSTISSILRDTPPGVEELKHTLPRHLGRIIRRCLAKDPDLRYQSARDVSIELKALKTETESQAPSKQATASSKTPDRKMIVILPFQNLGHVDDDYFAAGITEEITSRLAAVKDLGVISRTTAVKYERSDKTIGQIGQELGVGYVLEGTVRWARKGDQSRVRVTPQLIQVSDDSHLWSDRYDRDLDDIFEVQSEVAEQVIKQLNVTLLDSERRFLEDKPTENQEAYHAYLRGLEYALGELGEDRYRLAEELFSRAVELDPAFALAHAQLSIIHSQVYHFQFDRSEARAAKSKATAELALKLQPNLPKGHLALGRYHYSCNRDFELALQEFSVAEQGLPNDASIPLMTGALKRRQGRFEEGLQDFWRAHELNPRDAWLPGQIGIALIKERRYQEADDAYDLSISLAPNQRKAYESKAWIQMKQGNLAKSRSALETLPGVEDETRFLWFFQELFERRYRDALQHLAPVASRLTRDWDDQTGAQLQALCHQLMGEPDRARASYEAALSILEDEIQRRAADHRLHHSLGMVYAGLGRTDDALREGETAVSLVPISKDAVDGADYLVYFAYTLTMVGEHDAALEKIKTLLSIPSDLSPALLRIDPRWDPLRKNPRFQALAAGS